MKGQEIIYQWHLLKDTKDFLMKAGIAGLYLSLQAANQAIIKKNEQATILNKFIKWELNDQFINLFILQNEKEAFEKLISWAWQIRDDIYYMPGTQPDDDLRDNWYKRINTHKGLLNTFLQYGGKLRPALEDETVKIVPLDDSSKIKITFRPIKIGESIRQISQISEMIPLVPEKRIEKPGWYYPGSAPRFGKNDKGWLGSNKEAFILLFAPIACFYLQLPRTKFRKNKSTENWVFVIPNINSLEEFHRHHQKIYKRIQSKFDLCKVANLGEAGIRVGLEYATENVSKLATEDIYAVAMGRTNYFSSIPTVSTKIKKGVYRFQIKKNDLSRFELILQQFPDKKVRDNVVDDNQVVIPNVFAFRSREIRGRLMENLINNEYWYKDIYKPTEWQLDEIKDEVEWRRKKKETISVDTLWFEKLSKYERSNIVEITKIDNLWENPEERELYLMLSNDVLRNLLDQEEEALKRGGTRSLDKRWTDYAEEIRRSIMKAKTSILFRQTFLELLSKAGGSKKITEGKTIIWRYLNDSYGWQKLRDLTYLALVSFTDGRLGKSDKKEISND